MPLYEYNCSDHGHFEAFASLDERQVPSACPVCEQPSRRAISIPRLLSLPRHLVSAHERNERSRHEPHVCKGGCHHKQQPKKKEQKPALQRYQGARPWVIEHG